MATASFRTFDRAALVADVKMGYYLTAMSPHKPRPDDTSTLELKEMQEDRAREEKRFARESGQSPQQRAHERRADKAAYLRDKLAAAERAEREAALDDAE